MILIESNQWRLWSDPQQGVQWMAAQVSHYGQWYDVVPDCRPAMTAGTGQRGQEPAAGQAADAPLSAASFHMIPYSNRIRDARFTFQGDSVQLENAESHAIHGALRKLPWRVVSHDVNSLVCEFDSHSYGTINWPWSIRATIEQRIDDETLSSTISVVNTSDSDMPVGAGWHPYFVRSIANAMPTLTLPVDSIFPDASGDCLPDGEAIPLPDALDFRQPRLLDPDQRIDCCLAGLKGAIHIHWEDVGIELVMRASDECQFLVLFNPDKPHFAVEPVTNANDAFNLASRNIESGTTILPAGDTFSVSMSIQLRSHQS